MRSAKDEIDKLRERIADGEITFSDAALRFSDEKETRLNGGVLINPSTNDTRFELTKMDPLLYSQIKDLNDNQMSMPLLDNSDNSISKYKILKITNRFEEHKADFSTDYVKINGESRSMDQVFTSEITHQYEKNFNNASELVKSLDNKKASIVFKKSIDYYPFKLDEGLKVIKIIKNSANKIGIESKNVHVNGGLDANWLIKNGIPTVTFGNGHYNPHSLEEYLDIQEYEDSCRLAISIATR